MILGTEVWDELDEYEARLRAFSSYIVSFAGDALEYEKALRLVDKRRGDLLGEKAQGSRNDLTSAERGGSDESEGSRQRWRQIAAGWEIAWPLIRDAQSRGQVTQAAVLRLLSGPVQEPAGSGNELCTCPLCGDEHQK